MRSSRALRPRRLHRRGDPYPVLMGSGLLDGVGALVRRLWPRRRVAVVTQTRVLRLHGARLRAGLERAGVRAFLLRMSEGEAKKNLDTVSELYDRLLAKGHTREDAILAFGGGTVGDTAGFVAATYLRGVPYAQAPTTLLAQIDSAIGAKVGVNHERGKNLIGAIYRPSAVWIDPDLTRTLPERELRSGLFELVKYGFLGRRRILTSFERGTFEPRGESLAGAVAEAVRAKLDVVREDETETGRRRLLNFGHTIGHGLEAAGAYRTLTHGEAVGWGMIGAIRLGERLGRLEPATAARLEKIVRRVGPLPRIDRLAPRAILEAIRKDKKIGASGLRFVLPVGFGRVEIVEALPLEEVAWAVASLGSRAEE